MSGEGFRAVIFHIRISMGHERAAQAVAEAFRRRLGAGADVRLVDAMDFSSGRLAPVICGSYLSIVKYAPAMWDFLYDHPNSRNACDPLIRNFARLSRKKYLGLMADFRPHVVLCTQALPARILAYLRSWGYGDAPGMSAPIHAAVTDYSIHRYWPSPDIDGYFVPGAAEKNRLAGMGVPSGKIRCSGIPIHPDMADPVSAEQVSAERMRFGLEPCRPTILLMGGSRGLGLTAELMREIEMIPVPLNVLAPAGTNADVLRVTRAWAAQSRHRIAAFEYTSSIRTLYAMSDLAVTKPGGLTLAECLAVGLPMVIHHALPGQERHNLDFIRREGLGEIGSSARDVAARVHGLLMDQGRLDYLRSRMKSRAKPDAAFSIVDHLIASPPQVSPDDLSAPSGVAAAVSSAPRPVSSGY